MKKWLLRIGIGIAVVFITVLCAYKVWMSSNGADIEFLLLSRLKPSKAINLVSSPSGPNDEVIARLRERGILIAVNKGNTDGIEISITPTGLYSALADYSHTSGGLWGYGYTVRLQKIGGDWKVVSVESSYQV